MRGERLSMGKGFAVLEVDPEFKALIRPLRKDEYLQLRLCGLHGERGSRRLLRGTARGQRVRSGCQQDCRLLGLRLL